MTLQNPPWQGTKVCLAARLLRKPRPAIAGEHDTLAESCLTVEAKLGGPPGGCAIFQFCPVGMKIRSATLRSKSGGVFDLQASWFRETMVISNDIGVFLGSACRRMDEEHEKGEENSSEAQCKQTERVRRTSAHKLRLTWSYLDAKTFQLEGLYFFLHRHFILLLLSFHFGAILAPTFLLSGYLCSS